MNHLEVDRIKKLCVAAETDEKLFWKLLKGQRSSSQVSAFLVNGAFITEEHDNRDMLADHFEASGTPTASLNFDNEFANSISTHIKNIFQNCINDPTGALNEPLTYEEVAGVCSSLKPGVYEHVGYAGPLLWGLLFYLHQQFFENFSVSKFLKTGIILPLFKGKGAKANNKDNYRGITLFPTLCKIYEMILLNRLETFAADNEYFSELQFGFREGVGCIKASFTILETINHMLERGSKVFTCFLDVRKAFDTVWIEGLLFKLFSKLVINGRMWLVIKYLNTNVKAKVLYAGALSREIDILQGTEQGRILAPFTYKVHMNSLLKVSTDHCHAISVNRLSLPSPSFADDIFLPALYPSFLETLMNICHTYGKTWRYEFNHSKSGVVTFCKTKPIHSQLMREREWMLGEFVVDELFEYKNLGVLKNFVSSFASNLDDNIEKARKKAGMIFSSN